ncbi:CCA tRNA nucleotidyltransferase [Flavobacteriaceae bacterium]|jgi:putative nucleotidyltransferase with HDIG domain|nr:HD domain-containing protein [Cryomorphaceae bacterium]MDB3967674.1 CCA tRNA nucleotidyltransferase [Flavobacteriaceae bacterium]MBT3503699.1 HD domain-containing protein [Cryomorphaceae bacterium]MBT3689709.1 HD domain-containing protein [Cryomorphaceae bacterium]MBT4517475.1 HD domain-containing protein [Cryomorphaceae bacterium]
MKSYSEKIFNALDLDIFKIISDTADKLEFKTYIVGGFVRDIILNRSVKKDIDIMCVGSGIDLAKAVQKKINSSAKVNIFKRYGTAMINYADYQIEFVGSRKESYSKDSRNPSVESGDFMDDMLRRDFTINTLAISLNSKKYGELVDTFGGLNDLEQKIIITPLEPNKTFSDDPLRMLRAVRFASQLNFNIDQNTKDSIIENSHRLKILSPERIADEINKILMCENPSIGFKNLEKMKLLQDIIPELIDLKGVEEVEGQTHKDNFYHTLEVVDNISKNTSDIWLRWAALLHDVGKAPTKKFDKKIGWTFHGHEYIGSKMVKKIFERLNLPLNETLKYVQKIVMMSSRPIVISEDIVTDSAVRRLIYDAGNSIDDLLTLCEADITTKNIKKSVKYQNNFKVVRKKIRDVEERDSIRNFQPPITGEVIMKHFNIKPCKEIGIIKEKIKNAILDGEILNDYDEALDLMIKIGKSIGLEDE